MRVKAIQKMYYNRRDMLPGEEYDMDDREQSEANILFVLGKIEIISRPQQTLPTAQRVSQAPQEEPQQQSEPHHQTDLAMTTETFNSDPPKAPRYRRRDLRAQR